MPISLPRPEWAMTGLFADQYEVAVDRLMKQYGKNRQEARATLEEWDNEVTRRGQPRESPDYFKDVWRWLLPPRPRDDATKIDMSADGDDG